MTASGDYKVLRSCGLEDIVNGTRERVELPQDATSEQKEAYVEWHKDDAKAASLIASGLSKPVTELVLTCKNAKEIWDKLPARFERSSTQHLNKLIETFFRVKNYDNFMDLWDTIPTKKQSLNLLIEKLCTTELREQDINGSKAFVVSKARRRQTSNQQVKMTKSQLKQKFPCNICKQLGHWAAECPQNTRDSNKRKEKK
ncbi:uncharacterized protein LOC124775464 [Schistocerca piceifrons]|uniref:uncharacterized protein LOC124775464 n=1 Tax=Schistocerca piceifrons TaxID=274613 RepID=UPI001F5FCD57|nr:uncharacterized protein LOC124775464 [Schistocerca piceifrons]